MYYYDELLFSKTKLASYLETIKSTIKNEIQKEKEEYILNVGQESYIHHLKIKFEVENLYVDKEGAFVDPQEEDVKAEDFPNMYNVYAGKSYSKPVFYFHLPYTGNKNLLFMQASTYSLNPPRAAVDSDTIHYKYIQMIT